MTSFVRSACALQINPHHITHRHHHLHGVDSLIYLHGWHSQQLKYYIHVYSFVQTWQLNYVASDSLEIIHRPYFSTIHIMASPANTSPSPSNPEAPSTPTVLPIDPSAFELLITCNPPILESLLAQLPTTSIFYLYQTSAFLRDFFSKSPTSWRYISWRLYQPSISTAAVANTTVGQRQSSNYALDQILLNVINPFSTRLVSLELDNTAVSGATLTSTVLVLRRDTLTHVSVRGCKNVSLKYHINPYLQLHALARAHDTPTSHGSPPFGQLALKSLYTYRCRHHRRRPYLPSSLARKESDSEPTHELVLTCHKLGIWTDTAWCTTPGARCYRRRGYVKMRMPQDPREVWVVYDRLWRSRNWLGPTDTTRDATNSPGKKRKRDVRSWEFDEEAMNGEPIGTGPEAKPTPAHERQSHRKFVENIICHNCSAEILERCEQCSVMMHCAGCRKTLCASCAFDRPYLRNKMAPEEDKNKFWWAPGCAVSPCSMQDQDLPPPGTANGVPVASTNTLPNIKLKWCCTEPVFSGGGGITFGGISHRETDQIRAAPLPPGHGWEDPEFSTDRTDAETTETRFPTLCHNKSIGEAIGGRWCSIDSLFRTAGSLSSGDHPSVSVPRVLCDECYSSDHWRLKCQACFTSLCLKHDIGDRVKARICGFKDLAVEKQEYKSRQKAIKILAALMRQRKEKALAKERSAAQLSASDNTLVLPSIVATAASSSSASAPPSTAEQPTLAFSETAAIEAGMENLLRNLRAPVPEPEIPLRPSSPASNSSGAISRSTSPTPSTHSNSPTPEPSSVPRRPPRPEMQPVPRWQGCLSVFCTLIRSPGDHRRRCTAVMRQCFECKTHICGSCADSFEPPCPCKGCRAPQAQTVPAPHLAAPETASETPLFFCPNCRWHRMETGKCKKRSDAFLSAQQSLSLKKSKKKRGKLRKPIEERRLSSNVIGGPSSEEEAIDGLVEFFNCLNAQLHGIQAPESSTAGVPGSAYDDPLTYANQNDIQELEDMGALARDLIFRIQRLRDQFVPGSLAARALPDIRLQEVGESADAMNVIAALAEDDANDARPEMTGAIEVEPDELREEEAEEHVLDAE